MNFARLNHVLIPSTKEGRDRARSGKMVRVARPLTWLSEATTTEGRVLLLLTVMMALIGVDVQSTQVFLLWTALAGLLTASLIGRRWFGLSGVEVAVRAPRHVTEGEPLEISVELINHGALAQHAIRVAGPFLPWDGSWVSRAPRIKTLDPGERIERVMRAVFIERGEHHLDVFQAAALLPLGLALGPAAESTGCRFTVLPRAANVAEVSFEPGSADPARSAGNQSSQARGASFELLGVRAYRSGDPARDLHVRTWARTGQPHVREYQATQSGRVLLVLDAAGSRDEPAYEASIRLCAGICMKLVDTGRTLDLVVSSAPEALRGVGSHQESLTAALAMLGRTGPDAQDIALLWQRILTEIDDNTEGLAIVSSDAERGAELEARARVLGTALRCVRVVRSREALSHAREIAAEDIDHGRSLRL